VNATSRSDATSGTSGQSFKEYLWRTCRQFLLQRLKLTVQARVVEMSVGKTSTTEPFNRTIQWRSLENVEGSCRGWTELTLRHSAINALLCTSPTYRLSRRPRSHRR
jgi:hypothetical protein